MNNLKTTTPKEKTLTPKGQKRKEALLKQALKLFGEKGYRATTMDDIAHAANTGKGTLYWYWDGKEEIFLELLTGKFESYLAALEAPTRMNLAAPDKMLLVFAEIANIFGRYRKFCKLVYLLVADDSENFNTNVIQVTRKYYTKFTEIVTSIIQDGQAEGTIHKNICAETTAVLIISILDGVLAQENFTNKTFEITKLGETLLTLLKSGLFINK